MSFSHFCSSDRLPYSAGRGGNRNEQVTELTNHPLLDRDILEYV